MFMLKTSGVVDPWSFCEVRICPFASRLSEKKRFFFLFFFFPGVFFYFVIFSGWKKVELFNKTQDKVETTIVVR